MKKPLLLLFLLFLNSFAFAQVNPTLAVGLEKLTMNKGTIDVEVLTEIIMSKQKELKREALRRFMFKLFPEANFTTKYYVQNCLNVLLNEKNPQVIEKEILELTTNYSLSLGVAYAIIKANEQDFMSVKSAYSEYKLYSPYYQENIIKEKENYFKKSDKVKTLNGSIKELEDSIAKKLAKLEKDINISENEFGRLKSKKERLESYKKKLARLNLRKDIKNDNVLIQETLEIPFGIILDVVSLSLSNMPELQKKGFFKNKIDYGTSDFYLSLSNNDTTTDQGRKSKKLKESLDKMKQYVCEKIRPYIVNYDIINEFLKKNKNKKPEDIIADLRKESLYNIIPVLNNEKWSNTYPQIKNTLTAIKQLESVLSFINNSDINSSSKQIIVNPLIICSDNCNITFISSYKEIAGVKKSLEYLNKVIFDDEIKEQTDKIIESISIHLFLLSNTPMSQLKVIDSKDIVTYKISNSINDSINKINDKIIKLLNTSEAKMKPELTIDILSDAVRLVDILGKNQDDKSLDKKLEIETFIKVNYFNIKTDDFNAEAAKINNMITNLRLKIKGENDKIKELKKTRDDNYQIIAESDDFYNKYLTSVIKGLTKDNLFKTDNLDSLTISKASVILPKIYSKVKSLINNPDIHMSDIVYLDEYMVDKMLELKVRDMNNDTLYDSIIEHNKIIIPLLKIRALQNIKQIGKYDQELMSLFEFIANLNNLDKAETYQSIVNMLRDGSKKVEDNLTAGEFKDSYILFINAMKKYTLINPSEEYVEIDVISFLNDLQQYYNRNNKAVFSLYLSLGLNQNFFFSDYKISDQESINNIGFASEKIGVKWRITNFKRFEGYENVVKDDVYLNKKAPFINELYTIVYGSGLLYSLANTTTNENFDFPHVGAGVGMRFYNALDVNLIIGFPFVKDHNFGDNAFYGIGLDIPLGEYLEKLGSKN